MTKDSAVWSRADVLGNVRKAFLGRLARREHASTALEYLGGLGRWVGITGNVAEAGLLLVVRLWLNQAVFVHQFMRMIRAEGFVQAPPAGDTLIRSFAPLLLAMGLFTQPIALVLVLGRPGVPTRR